MEFTAITFLIGRILLGGYFLFNGVMHLVHFKNMVGYAASRGVPMATPLVFIASLMILFGGVGVLLGVYPLWSLWLLILFLIPVTFAMHPFWTMADPGERREARVQFLKNLTLLGALLMLLLVPTPWPFTIL